jgi:hypothetical protein
VGRNWWGAWAAERGVKNLLSWGDRKLTGGAGDQTDSFRDPQRSLLYTRAGHCFGRYVLQGITPGKPKQDKYVIRVLQVPLLRELTLYRSPSSLKQFQRWY